jgi:hypothetical protein
MASLKITSEWLRSVGSPCGPDGENRSWTAAQLELLCIKWPAPKGWTHQVIGREISPVTAHRIAELRGVKKTRAEKRAAIERMLRAGPARSDRAIASVVGVDHKTIAAVRKDMLGGETETPLSGQIPHNGGSGETHSAEIPQPGKSAASGEIKNPHSCGSDCPFCNPANERTFDSAPAWLIERQPPNAVHGLIAALQRRLDAKPASEITISWEAGAAARELTRQWSTTKLDEFREHLAAGKPTRMTETEKLAIWGSDKAPKSISIPDDPARAAEKLWLFWGATPGKLHRLRYEIGRRTQAPAFPRPKYNPEDADIPF